MLKDEKDDVLPDVSFGRMEELRKMVSPLSREQLVDVLCRSAAAHPDVLETANKMVNESPASRRLMIRNIAFSTTNDALYSKFETFGEIEDYTIVRDKESNKSKGFGFVTFKRAESVQAALKMPVQVDGRQLAVKLAADPIEDTSIDFQDGKFRRKLFIRNLSDNTTTQSLREYFEQFGAIEDAVVVKGHDGSSKGFGFVTFQRAEDGVKACQQGQRIIDGRMAFVSFASASSGHKNLIGQGGLGPMNHGGLSSVGGGGGGISMGGGMSMGGGGGLGGGGFGGMGNYGSAPHAGFGGSSQGNSSFGNKRVGSENMGFFRQMGAGPNPGQFVNAQMNSPQGGGVSGGSSAPGVSSFVDQSAYLQQLHAMHAMQLGITPQLPPQYNAPTGSRFP